MLKRNAELLGKSYKSMLHTADLKPGNDLALRTTDDKLFQQSMCL
jgi:hypothetical protein